MLCFFFKFCFQIVIFFGNFTSQKIRPSKLFSCRPASSSAAVQGCSAAAQGCSAAVESCSAALQGCLCPIRTAKWRLGGLVKNHRRQLNNLGRQLSNPGQQLSNPLWQLRYPVQQLRNHVQQLSNPVRQLSNPVWQLNTLLGLVFGEVKLRKKNYFFLQSKFFFKRHSIIFVW